MSRKYILIGSLLLPLMAASNLAYAGPQPSDPAWWPNHNRNYAPSRDFTTAPVAGGVQAVPRATDPRTCRYQGSRSLVCSTR